MTTNIDALHLRKTWGRGNWEVPEKFGPDGWSMVDRSGKGSVIVTCSDYGGVDWVHASVAWTDRLPTYDELVLLHRSIWKGSGYAYQCFVPVSQHVNIHGHALHLFGRRDGASALPEFTRGSGSI